MLLQLNEGTASVKYQSTDNKLWLSKRRQQHATTMVEWWYYDKYYQAEKLKNGF